MPKPSAVVDYRKCQPARCPRRCPAVEACERRVLVQDAVGEAPYPLGLCLACGSCVEACLLEAIQIR